MNTNGNTDAINRHLAEREAYDEQREQETELQDLRDAVDSLTARLAEVTAERDRLDAAIKRQGGAAKSLRQSTLAEVQHIKDNERKEYIASRTLDSEREVNAILTDELEAAEAMLPRAYRAGVDRAKQIADEVEECGVYFGDGNVDGRNSIYQQGAQEVADIIRARPTPTIEQLKEMLKDLTK